MNKKHLTLLILLTLLTSGVLLFGKDRFNNTDNTIIPTEFTFQGKTIALAWTDDNTGEDLIIQSDKKEYNGFNEVDIYFSVTNTNREDQNMDVVVWVGDEKVEVKEVLKIEGDNNFQFPISPPEADQPWAGNQFPNRKDIKSFTNGYAVNDQIKTKQTNFYRARIKYPPMSDGEFFIEAFGNSKFKIQNSKLAYGHLDPWYSSSWSYRRQIVIDHSEVNDVTTPSTTYADFPVYVHVTGLSNVKTDGADIRFTNLAGTELPREIEKYDSGTLDAWVKFTLTKDAGDTSDDVIYMYYGNSSATEPAEDATYGRENVWDGDYKLVQHLQEDPGPGGSGDIVDSTQYDNDGTAEASMTTDDQVAGQLDGSLDFDMWEGNVGITDSSELDGFSSATWSFWTKPYGVTRDYVGFVSKYYGTTGNKSWSIRQSTTDGELNMLLTDSSGTVYSVDSANVNLVNNTMYYIVITYDNGTINYYKGGSFIETDSVAMTDIYSGNYNVYIGSQSQAVNYFGGIIDEIRISSTARTSDWIATEYANQDSSSTFLTINAEEDNTPTEFASTIMQSSGDYSSLSAWETALSPTGQITDLTATTTRVFSGSASGTLLADYPVELYRGGVDTGIDGNVVAHTADGQILIDGITGISYELVAQNNDQWRYNDLITNMWTIAGATGNELGDSAIAVAKIDGTWTVADGTAVMIDDWTTSATNYIKVYTTDTARHNGKWNTNAHRIENIGGSLIIGESHVKLDGLQIRITVTDGNPGIYSATAAFTGIEISNCIVTAVANFMEDLIHFNNAGITAKIWNTIVYVEGTLYYFSKGIYIENASTVDIYNCVVYNMYDGIERDAGIVTVTNTVSFGNSDDFDGAMTIDHCASDDGDGTNAIIPSDWSNVFVDYVNRDFHLKSTDTDLKDAGINLSSTAGFTDDIDSDTRPASNWDIGADEAETAVEFVSTIMQSGGEYSRLYDWEAAIDCDLTAPTTRVYSYDANSGTIADGASVSTDGGSSTATLVHQASNNNQILLIDIDGEFNDNDVVVDGSSNTVTLSNNGNTAIAVAKIDGAWTIADTQAVAISNWTTSASNYVKIYTTESARHSGVWDDGKYRLEVGNNRGIGCTSNVKIDGLQIKLTLSNSNSNSGIAVSNNNYISNNIIVGVLTGTSDYNYGISNSGGTDVSIWNNILYDFNLNNASGILNNSGTMYAYNNTIVDSKSGIGRNNGTLIAKNNIAQNCTTAFFSLSSGSINNIATGVNFLDVSNNDFHLATSDTAARDAGVDLSTDTNLSFTDDIDGEARPGGSGWDIGADELKKTTQINTPHTNKWTDGLVGYWSFDGQDMDWSQSTAEARDTSGNNNHGDVINGATSVIGKVGQGLEFDGVDDYVNVGDIADGLSEITVCAWVKADVANTNSILIASENSSFLFYRLHTEQFNFMVYNDLTNVSVIGDTTYRDTDWHHVCGTYDGAFVDLFVDGADDESAANALTGTIRTSAADMLISDSSGWDGLIDEVRVYNRALLADEILEQYQVGARKLQTNTPITNHLTDGLVGHWTFNGEDMDWGSSTAEALDVSGSSNHGDVVGATAVIGKVGQGIEFDGVDDYVEAGNVYNGVKTVTFWVKTDGSENAVYFDGQLDEVRFYDRTLSADQIGQLYRIGNRSMKIGSGADYALSSTCPTSQIIVFNVSANIEVDAGTIIANNFAEPTIYVDAVATSTIDNNWRFVAVTTVTGVNADTASLGKATESWTCGYGLLTDYDNNDYGTAKIGDQCWMAENLMVLHNADGTDPDGTGDGNTTPPVAYDDANWEETEGYLYNWQDAMNGSTTEGVQGICPTGWHVPTDDELKTLEGTVDSTYGVGNSEWDGSGYRGDDAGRELKAANNVNGETGATNGYDGYGFTSLLAGFRNSIGTFDRGTYAAFWSSSQYNSTLAWNRYLCSSYATVYRHYYDKGAGFSIRCLKD